MSKSNFQKGDRAKSQLNKLTYLHQTMIEVSVNKINEEITFRLRMTDDSKLGEDLDAEIILVPEQQPDC